MMRCRMKFACVFFFFSLALLSGMSLPPVTSAVIRCRETEREALLEFKQRLNDPSNRLSSWVGEDCCAWQGVGCSNITARVTKLDLRNDINIPLSYILIVIPELEWEMLQLRGNINTPSLLSLEQLTHLDLSGNAFTGPIPTFLGSFARLTYLDLSNAGFSGKVPDQLGNLSTLRHLDLSYSEIYEDSSQQLYVENPGWITHLTSLRHLNMSGISFRRTSNWFEAINALPRIQDIELYGCELGSFPRSPPYLNFTSLRSLNLGGYDINSAEPTWVYNITTTEHLDFRWNDIYWSSMHDSITRLASLKALDLSGNKVSNSFLLSLSNLSKLQILSLDEMPIKDELSNLHIVFSGSLMYSLEKLSLANNQLNGSLPNWLGNMKNLRTIDLRNNLLHGTILNSLGSLTSLQYLDLSYNNLNETYNSLHGSILNSLGSLTSLQYLDLSYNKLTGTYNLLNFLRSLTSLQYLDLSDNKLNEAYNLLHGSILNSLGSLTSLQYLWLSYNNLNETIGESIGQLKNLISLDLSSNSLSLSLIHLTNLSSLKYLDISNNLLFINETNDWIPTFQLQFLFMSSCKIEPRPSIPKWLQYQKNLIELDLENAGIEDIFPSLLPSSLRALFLSNNSFSSYLPPNIGNILPNIYLLDLSSNNFNGSIPHSLCQLHLMLLQLSKNNFSGELPNCWDSFIATIFDFSNNQFQGEIPNTLCNLWSMKSLHLSYNHLSGRIPLCLQDCRGLVILDAGHNNFTGNIPAWSTKSLPYLQSLSLCFNYLTGNISELFDLPCLQVLDLSNNSLSGSIPTNFGNLTVLGGSTYCTNDLNYIFDDYKLWLRIKGIEYEYESLLTLITSIDLSNNDLSGYIPKELKNLHGLQNLNLSGNNLVGEIPNVIGEMQSLEVLDLSRNNLSGEIPSTLAYLNFLDKLNLSYNNLSGYIPTGRQLQTFDPFTYLGNPYLCGPPLSKKCTKDTVKGGIKEENKDDNGKKETIWLFTSITLGFIIGFWGILGTLLLHKSWRILYFYAIDNSFDKLGVKILVKITRKLL